MLGVKVVKPLISASTMCTNVIQSVNYLGSYFGSPTWAPTSADYGFIFLQMAIAKINHLAMIGVELEVQCYQIINFSNDHAQTLKFKKLAFGKCCTWSSLKLMIWQCWVSSWKSTVGKSFISANTMCKKNGIQYGDAWEAIWEAPRGLHDRQIINSLFCKWPLLK